MTQNGSNCKVRRMVHKSAIDLFGVKKERAESIQKEIAHAMIECDNMVQVGEHLDLTHSGELCFKAFLLGIATAHREQEQKMEQLKSRLGL